MPEAKRVGATGIHSRKEQRFICHECQKTFSASKGTAFYRLRTSAETVVIVVTLLAHGCPLQAIVAAFGFDERTIAAWWARSGHQGQAVHEYLVEQPRDLGQVQADELRVKKQGGIVWMALAMMVKTRLWLGGEVSEQRDMALIRRLVERVRRCAARRPLLVCTDGLVSYIRAIRETFRDPMHTGKGGRPRLRPWRNVLIAQVVKRHERRVWSRPNAALSMARRHAWRRSDSRSQGNGVINTAYIERLNATFRGTPRAAGASVPGAGTPHPDTARGDVLWWARSITFARRTRVYSHAQKTTPAMAAGITDHRWTMHELLSLHVPPSRWVPPKQRGRPSRALRHTNRAMVCVTTVSCGATDVVTAQVISTATTARLEALDLNQSA